MVRCYNGAQHQQQVVALTKTSLIIPVGWLTDPHTHARPIMADLDSLIVTFQAQLSDVMESVVKTAVYEVTRLVEDGLLEEVKRREQEVEALRVQLRWAERRLSDHGGREDVELSSDIREERPAGQQGDLFRGRGLKSEGERWTRGFRQGVALSSVQTADAHSPESQAPAEEEGLTAVDVKEEEGSEPSCSSVHGAGWSGEAGPESHSTTEITEAQPGQTQEHSEELLRTIIKQDPQLNTAFVFREGEQEAHVAKEAALEEDGGWVGLTVTAAGAALQSPMCAAEPDCDAAQTRGSVRPTEHCSIAADVSALVAAGRDPISSPASPKVRLQNSGALNVTIKQEVIADSDTCEKIEFKDRKSTKSGMAALSSSVKQHRASLETLKQNRISHKAAVQEVMKLQSKAGAGLRLQADPQHPQRPVKRSCHAVASSTAHAAAAAPSQAAHASPLSRVPSTSKAAPPSPLSVQRLHQAGGDKQAAAQRPWAAVRTQLHSANSHHPHGGGPHPDPHGPRHLLRCGQCGKCFPHPSNLKAHLQTHTGERPFCCSLCGRSFTKLSNLKAHRRVHTGERPYCCLACGKRFTQKCNLKRHQRIHLDV